MKKQFMFKNIFKRKLTAKRICKLRKKWRLMRKFKVKETAGLFGNFYWQKSVTIRAYSPYGAMQKYFDQYYKKYKELHKFSNAEDETTYNWATIRVKDENGFKTYYR